MNVIKSTHCSITLTFLLLSFNVKSGNYLEKCWIKQVKPIANKFAKLCYSEKLNELEHSFEPWQQTNYLGNGTFWINRKNYFKTDTLRKGKKQYFSQTQLNDSTLVFRDYGDKKLFPVTKAMFDDYKFKIARYSPIFLIDYFYFQKVQLSNESNKDYYIYESSINNTIIKLFISRKSELVYKVWLMNNDDLFGDVLTIISYSDYSKVETSYYPKAIKIEKINGNLIDEVHISDCKLENDPPPVIGAPPGYQLIDTQEKQQQVSTQSYNSNIHFIEIPSVDARALIVEFKDFLLVSEAPLNTRIGDLIIKEAKRISANKPIKFFTFSHYHPYAIGGIRSFIHEGATIICYKEDFEYVKYIASAPHTIEPDNLHSNPHELILKELIDSVTISDGDYELKIYHIGRISAHTKDYLIYFFPKERLLFENDLVWVPKHGKIGKAVDRQSGLYNAITDLKLNVSIIVQSWPMANGGVKSLITFEDLKNSIQVQ